MKILNFSQIATNNKQEISFCEKYLELSFLIKICSFYSLFNPQKINKRMRKIIDNAERRVYFKYEAL